MSIEQLLQLIVGAGEVVVPIFIHNPKSQQIKGVIVSNLSSVLKAFPTLTGQSTQPQPTQQK
jgi:arylsulfatase A-like enzyme